jgi:hypothetical protein
MTYIGDINELANIMDNLRHYPRFERLEAGIRSKDWEQFESTFAVAREAHHFHIKRRSLEFEPEVIVNGKSKFPDFRARLINRWAYFEVKASSMFPFEKELLKIEDKVHEGLSSISSKFKFVVKIHQEKFSEKDITPLANSIQRIALNLQESGANFPHKCFYPNRSSPIAEYIFLGSINSVVYVGDVQLDSPFTPEEEFIWIRAAIPKEGGKGNFALLKALNSKKLMFMGSEEFDVWKYLKELVKQLWGTQVSLDEPCVGLFLLNLINILSMKNYLMIGVSPPYKPENRVKKIINDALQQLPPNNPNVVVIYSREVILQMNEIEKSLENIFTSDKYNRISGVIADIQLATDEKKRRLFTNPNATISLTKDEISCLDL